jgi:FixJ family two-component response regulator
VDLGRIPGIAFAVPLSVRGRRSTIAAIAILQRLPGDAMHKPTPMITVVDDDASVARALRRLIGSAGYLVETFASARDFLGSMPSPRTACLVLDIYLEGMNGFELQEQMAADRLAIPIIFMTAHDNSTTRERIRRSGMAGYLVKPFDGQVLLDAILQVAGPALAGA